MELRANLRSFWQARGNYSVITQPNRQASWRIQHEPSRDYWDIELEAAWLSSLFSLAI